MSSIKLRKEKDCLNCGRTVEENFCPYCGQENIEVKEDAFHMVAHAVADYFHFEHKFFGTIKPLLFKPGLLTKQYVAGKRVSFIHPIRLYIFISIVFFLVILSGSNKHEEKKETPKAKATTSKQLDSLQAAQLKNMEVAMQYLPVKGAVKDSILKATRESIAKEAKEAKENENESKPVIIDLGNGKKKNFNGIISSNDTSVAAYEKRQLSLPKNKRDGFLKHYFTKRNIELNQYPNPKEKFIEDLLHNIPKMMFLLLPMFALILKLVYLRKKKYYYEHLIYSFHVHSAIFLSILITMLLQWIFKFFYEIDDLLATLCLFYILWYIYRSLRTFYGSTRWVTILKICFLNLCYTLVLTLCFIIIIAFSFITV